MVGESGSGKSTMALTIMRLIKPPARVVSGNVWLDDTDLLAVSDSQMKDLRLAEIAMVAQGSMNSLNPVMRVRTQIGLGLRDHGVNLSKNANWRRELRPCWARWASLLRSRTCTRTSSAAA